MPGSLPFELGTQPAISYHNERIEQANTHREVDQVPRAFVRLELADVEHVRLGQRPGHAVGGATNACDVDRIGNVPDVGARQLRRPRLQIGMEYLS
jgi:hypothetical protein